MRLKLVPRKIVNHPGLPVSGGRVRRLSMKLVLVSAAMALTAIPAAPALAHCRTAHHKIHHVRHVAVAQARVRHHPVRYASACGCEARVAYRPAVYPVAYPRPHVVEVTYERPRPFYRP